MSQLSSLSATFKTQVKLKGNKPRIGIALSGIRKYYSRGAEFAMTVPATPFSSASVFQKDVGQSPIANGSYTKLEWSATKDWDDNSDFSGEKFTPSVAGKYLITGHIWLASEPLFIGAGDILALAVYKNGSIHKRADIGYVSTGNFEGPMVSVIVEANGTSDYFELYLYQNTGDANQTISTSEVAPISRFSYFQATLLTKDNNPLPSFSAYMSATQAAIANTTYTKLVMDTEDWDSHGEYDAAVNYRFTPQTAGKYLLTGHLLLESGTMVANDLYAIAIYKNGSIYKQAEIRYSSTGNLEGPAISIIATANGSTDYFEMWMWQNTGGNVATIPTGEATGGISIYCYFQGCCLAENDMPSFSAYQQDAGQAGIVKNTWTKLVWNSEEWDVGSDFASSKWTPGTAGKYIITGHAWLDSVGNDPSNGVILALSVYKNGQIYKQAEIKYNGTGTFEGPMITTIVEANGTDDYFELYIWHGITGNQTTVTTGDVGSVRVYTYFQGCGIVASTDTVDVVNTFVDELANAPSLSISSKMTGGLSTINRLNVDILNQDLTSDLFVEGGSYADPENTEVKAYLVFDSGSTLLADSIQFFKGMIDDFPTIDFSSVKIACTSIDKRIFKKIGQLVTADDAFSGFPLPEESLGRIKPIIYGDHRFGINFTKDNSQLASNYPFKRENNVVEAVPLGGSEFLIADHIINSIESNGDGIWFYDEMLGRLVEVNDFTVTQNNAQGCIINVTGTTEQISGTDGAIITAKNFQFDSAAGGFTSGTPDAVQVGDKLVITEDGSSNLGTYSITHVNSDTQLWVFPGVPETNVTNLDFRIIRLPNFNDWRSPTGANTSSSWVNIDRLHDLSLVAAAQVTTPGGAGGGGGRDVNITFDIFPYNILQISAIKLYIKGKMSYITDHVLYVNGSGVYDFPDETNDTQFHTHDGTVLDHYINSVNLAFEKTAGTTASTMSVYEAIQKITYFKNVESSKMKIYFGGLGREYSSWISGRTSHQDDPGLGNLIENAAGCVESLMRDVLLLGSSNINNTAFDTASAGDLASSKLSFSITKRTESDKLIHDILERVKSLGFFDFDDQFKMVVYDNTDDFTEASSGTPNDDDIFILDANESGSYDANTRAFDEHPIVKDSFWIKKNPASQIVTNFTVEYFKTYDGKFARTLLDTDNTYHDEDISKIFEHPYTKDETTAQIWLTFLIDRLNRKHWAAGWDTFYQAIPKEMWDVVNVQHPVIENLVSSYLTKKWRILLMGIQADLGKISIEVEEQ